MNITVTITGDAISPEVVQMLQALGVALSNEKAPKQAESAPIIDTPAPEPAEAETPVKKPRKSRKTAEREPEVTEEPATEEEAAEPYPEETITMESLREKVVFLAKSGKSDAVKDAFAQVGAAKLSDVKKSDFQTLDNILSEI